jgi:hypothetical protein
MRFKIKGVIIILLVFLVNQFLFSGNPQILKSPANPIHGKLNLKLEKDLVLGEETPGPYLFSSINGIEVSDKYIYVLDSKMAKVNVYDLKGRFIREIGRKGEGPGEFMIPGSFYLSDKGDLYIYDLQRKRISVFSHEGNFKRDFIVEETFSLPMKFYVDEKNYIYTILIEFSPTEIFLNFVKMDSGGKVKKIFYKTSRLTLIPFESKGMKGNLFYEHPYMAHLYFTNISEDNFALMNSMRYEIILFSKEGDILARILKDERDSKVTGKEREIALSKEKSGIPKELQKYATFSDTRPFCSNLSSDENGRIYVERFRPVTEKGKTFNYDIFNSKGEYLYKLSLDFKIDLIKDGYIYSVSINGDTGVCKIIRYKIENWNEIKL